MTDFSARHYNKSVNEIVWNQQLILASAVEVRKKGYSEPAADDDLAGFHRSAGLRAAAASSSLPIRVL